MPLPINFCKVKHERIILQMIAIFFKLAWVLDFFNCLITQILFMKKFKWVVITLFSAALAFYSFRSRYQTSIVGRINPVGGANMVYAINGRDSSSSTIVNGAFNLMAKQGVYKVVIDAVEPYKDAILENIDVKDGQTVDVGEVVLQRQ
jgi:hypothetical protein